MPDMASIARDPDWTIQETAAEMGFSDPSAFQRWKGVTPGQFKGAKA